MQNSQKTRYVAQAAHRMQLLMLRQSQALLNAIKEYETNKWKVIGAKVGKPAKVRPPTPPLLSYLPAPSPTPHARTRARAEHSRVSG